MTGTRRSPRPRLANPLQCCYLLVVLVIVAAELEYYPDLEAAGSPSSQAERFEDRQAQVRARLERFFGQSKPRGHRYERDKDQDEPLDSAALIANWLRTQREQQRLRYLERPETPERAELLQRARVVESWREEQQQRQQQREEDAMVRQRQLERQWDSQRLESLKSQLRQQLHQRLLQELDYPELEPKFGRQPRPEFTYSLNADESAESDRRPFGVGPDDPRFHSDEAWALRRQDNRESAVVARAQGQTSTTTETAATTGWRATEQTSQPRVIKMEQRRASKHNVAGLADELRVISLKQKLSDEDVYVIAMVAGCSAALMFALVLMSLLWCRLQRVSKAAKDVDYPAYGVTGPNKDLSPSSAADQRLAQSAQMYHFQHQKQQIIAMEKASTGAAREPGSVSEAESDEENDEGDYTVYECPGLAPTGEMEVKNPLFHDEPTPQTPAKSKHDDATTTTATTATTTDDDDDDDDL